MTRSKPRKSGLRAAREAMYRTHILEVAEARFAEQGFAATRMQDIAAAAEISLATLYQMFAGKQELYRQILISRDEQIVRRVMADGVAAFQGGDGIRGVLTLLGAQVGYLLEHPDYLRLQLQDGRLWFHSDTRPSAAEQQLWEQGMDMMRQVFRWGISEGLLVPGEPEELGRMLLALQQTRLANWVQGGMAHPHAEVIAQVQADFVRFFCQPGVAARMLTADGQALAESMGFGETT